MSGLTLPPYWMRKRRGRLLAEHLCDAPPDEGVGILCLLRRGVLAGADGPDRLVGDHQSAQVRSAVSPARPPESCVSRTASVRLAFALLQRFADAEDHVQPGGQRRLDLAIDERVVFVAGCAAVRCGR